MRCDQTLSPGADVAAAVSTATNGATICLEAGDYCSVQLFDISRTGLVTSVPRWHGRDHEPQQVGRSSFIRFEQMISEAQQLQHAHRVRRHAVHAEPAHHQQRELPGRKPGLSHRRRDLDGVDMAPTKAG